MVDENLDSILQTNFVVKKKNLVPLKYYFYLDSCMSIF